jgi:hypothetical protein
MRSGFKASVNFTDRNALAVVVVVSLTISLLLLVLDGLQHDTVSRNGG